MAFCVGCKNELTREVGKDGVFRDETGAEWEGSRCPACVFVIEKPAKMSARKCRKCSAQLPASRYFHCYPCQPSSVVDEVSVFSGQFTGLAHKLKGVPAVAGISETDSAGYLET